MNNKEKNAHDRFKLCVGKLCWVKQDSKGFWLFVDLWTGGLFKYVAETDEMRELEIKEKKEE